MVDKICPNMKFIASLHHFPSTAKHLENIRLHMVFSLLLIYNLKTFFECFLKNAQLFSYSLISQNIKNHKA